MHAWDVLTRVELDLPLTRERDLSAAAFSADARFVLTVGRNGAAHLWDTATGTPACPTFQTPVANGVAVAPNGRYVAVSDSQAVELWDTRRGERVGPPMPLFPSNWFASSRFSPAGTWLAMVTVGGLQIVDGRTGAPGLQIEGGSPRLELSFTPNERFVASSRGEEAVGIRDVASGEPVSPALRHQGLISSANFTPDGSGLLTSSHDWLVRFWPLRREEGSLADLERLSEVLTGRHLASIAGKAPVTGEGLRELWQAQRASFPDRFGVSVQQERAWHQAQAEEFAEDGSWREAAVHFEQALGLGSPRWRLAFGRGRARAELGQWTGAAQDFASALDIIPGELEPIYDAALIHLNGGERRGPRTEAIALVQGMEVRKESRSRPLGGPRGRFGSDRQRGRAGPGAALGRDRSRDRARARGATGAPRGCTAPRGAGQGRPGCLDESPNKGWRRRAAVRVRVAGLGPSAAWAPGRAGPVAVAGPRRAGRSSTLRVRRRARATWPRSKAGSWPGSSAPRCVSCWRSWARGAVATKRP